VFDGEWGYTLAWTLISLNFLFIITLSCIQNKNQPMIQVVNKEKRILFVISHPDDESMFFVPTILNLKAEGYTLELLCLSNGNYDGLGKIREIEMQGAGDY